VASAEGNIQSHTPTENIQPLLQLTYHRFTFLSFSTLTGHITLMCVCSDLNRDILYRCKPQSYYRQNVP